MPGWNSTDVIEATSSSADDDSLSAALWKTVATHGREAGGGAAAIADELGLDPPRRRLLELAGRWHDAGKVHSTFQDAIKADSRAAAVMEGALPGPRSDLAKAPQPAWRRPAYPARPGFRHELASGLMLFETLRRAAPLHPALAGGVLDVLDALGTPSPAVDPDDAIEAAHPLARELMALDADALDLLAWLVVTHHGKVRVGLSSTPRDQEQDLGAVHGVCDGDDTPAFELTTAEGDLGAMPPLTLSLDVAQLGVGARYGRSWSDRVDGLLRRHGPFQLAWLEALLRAADVRASRLDTEDVLL